MTHPVILSDEKGVVVLQFPPILEFLAKTVYTIKENELIAIFDKGTDKNGSEYHCLAIYNSKTDKTIFRYTTDEYLFIPIKINPPELEKQIHEVLKARYIEATASINS